MQKRSPRFDSLPLFPPQNMCERPVARAGIGSLIRGPGAVAGEHARVAVAAARAATQRDGSMAGKSSKRLRRVRSGSGRDQDSCRMRVQAASEAVLFAA